MVEATTKLKLRYMRPADVPEVVTIDRVSFTPPWPPSSYRFEIHESKISYMAVLEKDEPRDAQGIWRIWQNLRGQPNPFAIEKIVVGYGGLWHIADEAHISTIASHPDHRGQKFGEIVLAGMVRRAIALGAGYVVLEVRVSNEVAQALYRKYGFDVVGVKPDYYHHDREDAYDMRLMLTQSQIAQFDALYAALQERVPFEDDYSHIEHPRLGR